MSIAFATDRDGDGAPERAVPGPAPRLHPLPAPEESQGGDPALSGQVLVTEDNAGLRTSLRAILEAEGHRVVEAEDGSSAYELLNRQHFDVLVLDLAMPGRDGVWVLEHITPPPPVVIIYSAMEYFRTESIRLALGPKVFRFLRKPVPPIDLVETVAEALRSQGA